MYIQGGISNKALYVCIYKLYNKQARGTVQHTSWEAEQNFLNILNILLKSHKSF